LQSLPTALQKITTLVCPREEYKELNRRYGELGCEIVIQNSTVKNIAEKRAWMMKWARDKHERVVMIDDDCYFFARCPVEKRNWEPSKTYWVPQPGYKLLSVEYATPKHLTKTFEELNAHLADCGHGGLSSRNGNHVVKEEVIYNTRMMHCIGYDVETFAQHVKTKNRPQVREDFDYTLQLLRAGFSNAVIHHTCVSPGAYNAPGGCSEERDRDLSNRQAHWLAELHPGLVKVRIGVIRFRERDTEFKNSNVESERLEVTVQWRKAYESAPTKRKP
jgi:hypothetical protein